jgi:predicted transcriptional regulator
MSMLEQWQKLDDLIVDLTKGKVKAELRNQLALTREQVEAYQAQSDQQDETLARQLSRIEELEQANKELAGRVHELEAQLRDEQASPPDEALPILMFLFSQGVGMTVEEIADAANHQSSAVEYYCGQLEKGRFLRQCRFHGEQRRLYGSDCGYILTQKGRAWVMEQSGPSHTPAES